MAPADVHGDRQTPDAGDDDVEEQGQSAAEDGEDMDVDADAGSQQEADGDEAGGASGPAEFADALDDNHSGFGMDEAEQERHSASEGSQEGSGGADADEQQDADNDGGEEEEEDGEYDGAQDEDIEGDELAEDAEEEEEEEDGEEEEEEEEEEDDECPVLKYQRLSADVTAVVTTDRATCMHLSAVTQAIGFESGRVLVTDLDGHVMRSYVPHEGRVTGVCVEYTGKYVASCGVDRTVLVVFLDEGTAAIRLVTNAPVYAVALHPSFGDRARSEQPLVYGGASGKFTLNRTKWFTTRADTILHPGDGQGPVHAIVWCGDNIAWANDTGVKICDYPSEKHFSFIQKPPQSPPASITPCHLYWEDEATLLIGWADSVRIVRVTRRQAQQANTSVVERHLSTVLGVAAAAASGAPVQTGGPVIKSAAIIHEVSVEYFVCGIAPFGGDCLALLGVFMGSAEDEQDDPSLRQPELCIISRDNGLELSSDMLPIADFTKNSTKDYRLCCEHRHHVAKDVDGLPVLIILSPKDIVAARPRGLEDRIQWAQQQGKVVLALSIALENEQLLPITKLREVKEQYLARLVADGAYQEAVDKLSELLGDESELWQSWVGKILETADADAKTMLARLIPGHIRLNEFCYTHLLIHLLAVDLPQFMAKIPQWSGGLEAPMYDAAAVIAALQARVKSTHILAAEYPALRTALGMLFQVSHRFSEALQTFLDPVCDPEGSYLFGCIRRHSLSDMVKDQVAGLFRKNATRAAELVVEFEAAFPLASVVQQLQSSAEQRLKYLDLYFRQNAAAVNQPDNRPFLEDLARLKAQLDPSSLITLFRECDVVSRERALEICEEFDKNVPADVFIYLYKELGNFSQAMGKALQRHDMQQAIAIVLEVKDPRMWQELIEAAKAQNLILELLGHIGGFPIDPSLVIQELPEFESNVPRDLLLQVFEDQNRLHRIQAGCNGLLHKDVMQLWTRLVDRRRSALKVEAKGQCGICEKQLTARIGGLSSVQEDLIVFFCTHSYHASCLVRRISASRRSRGASFEAMDEEEDTDRDLFCVLCHGSVRAAQGGVDLHRSGSAGAIPLLLQNKRNGAAAAAPAPPQDLGFAR